MDNNEHEIHTEAKYREALSKHPEIEQHFPTYAEWVEFMVLSDQQMIDKDDPDTIVDIKDINQFAAMVSHWHQNMLARLRNLRDIPNGTQVGIEDAATGKAIKVVLKGDGMKGFQAAINAAIAELSQFPFVVSMEDDTANDSTPQDN